MRVRLDPEGVARHLPDAGSLLEDPRLRPVGVVGGLAALTVAALLQLQPVDPFWSAVVGGVLAFVGVPLFAVGIAAPEPVAEGALFRLGVTMTELERRVVAAGAALVVVAPMLVATLGPAAGFADWVWLTGAALAFGGAVTMLVGFLSWSSKAVADPAGIE